MAKKEEVVKETTEQPKIDDKVEKLKIKKKPVIKKFSNEDEIVKVDLSKPIEKSPVEEKITEEKAIEENPVEEVAQSTSEETPILEEISNETSETKDIIKEEITQPAEVNKDIPENIQKLMDFMDETGGDVKDM